MAVLCANAGGPVSADAGEVAPSASCGTPLLLGAPSVVTAGALFVTKSIGATGAHAQMRYWWFRNEPPNAPEKKLSASTYCCASL